MRVVQILFNHSIKEQNKGGHQHVPSLVFRRKRKGLDAAPAAEALYGLRVGHRKVGVVVLIGTVLQGKLSYPTIGCPRALMQDVRGTTTAL